MFEPVQFVELISAIPGAAWAADFADKAGPVS
jgi:hypothetical protein